MNEQKLPEFFIEMLNNQYPSDVVQEIIRGYCVNRNVTLRVNTIKSDVSKVKTQLDNANIKYEEVAWSPEALIINNVREKEIQELEIYEKGEIYLQSLSSMLPPIILGPKPNLDILDMAAAPGGKTTQMAALSNNQAHITACEMNSVRAERLKYNVEKQGASCVYVMVSDSRKIDDFFSFDNILLDSPCSGSGTLNVSDPNLEKRFTMKLVQKSVNSQKILLRKALKVLKKGQEMVYSTCSILSCENEEVVKQILKECKAEIVPIEFQGMEDLPILPTGIPGTLNICPTELFEGFFVAKIRKL